MSNIEKKAIISDCQRYRYALWRIWDEGEGFANFIGLNPSTADAVEDDPTIRRCVGFAKSWGLKGICMSNLFAFRATDPKVMLAENDPIGPDNEYYLRYCATGARFVIAAWGKHGAHRNRAEQVRYAIPNLHFLKLNKDGSPSHPLYLPKTLKPQFWN